LTRERPCESAPLGRAILGRTGLGAEIVNWDASATAVL
jgi:hypothetical protein